MPRKKRNKAKPPILPADHRTPQQIFEEIEKLFIVGSYAARAKALEMLEQVFDSSPLYSILAFLFLNPFFGGDLYQKSKDKITENLQWFADNKTSDDIHLFAYILSAYEQVINVKPKPEPKVDLMSLLSHFSSHPQTARMQFLLGTLNFYLATLMREEFIKTNSADTYTQAKRYLSAAYQNLSNSIYPPSHWFLCRLFLTLLPEQKKCRNAKFFKHEYGFSFTSADLKAHLLRSAQTGLIPFQEWHKPILEYFLKKYSLPDIQSFFEPLQEIGDISLLVEASFNFLCAKFKLNSSPSFCISKDMLSNPNFKWFFSLLKKVTTKSSLINYQLGLWLPFNQAIEGFESKTQYFKRAFELSETEEERLSLSCNIILHLIPLIELSQDYTDYGQPDFKPIQHAFDFLFTQESIQKTEKNMVSLAQIQQILYGIFHHKVTKTTDYNQILSSYEDRFTGELYYYHQFLLLCEKMAFPKARDCLFNFFMLCLLNSEDNQNLSAQYTYYSEEKTNALLSTVTAATDDPLIKPDDMDSITPFFYRPALYLKELKELDEKIGEVLFADSDNFNFAFLNQESQGKTFHYFILLAYLKHYKISELLSAKAESPLHAYMFLLLSLKGNYYHAFYLLAETLREDIFLKNNAIKQALQTSFEKNRNNPNPLIKHIVREFYELAMPFQVPATTEHGYRKYKIFFLIQQLGLEEADIISLFHRCFSTFEYNHYRVYVSNMHSEAKPSLNTQRKAVEYEEMMTTYRNGEDEIILKHRDRILYLAACLGYATAIHQVSSLMVDGKYAFHSQKVLHLHYINDFIGLHPLKTYAYFLNETLYEICEVGTLSDAVKLACALSTIQCDEIAFVPASLELNWDGQKYSIKIQPIVKKTNSSFILAKLQYGISHPEDEIKNKLLQHEKEWACLSSNLEYLQEKLSNILFCRDNIHLSYHEGAFAVKFPGSLSNDTIKMLLVEHKDLFQFNIVKKDQFLFVFNKEALKDRRQVDKIIHLVQSATVDHLGSTSAEPAKKTRVPMSPIEQVQMNLNTAYAVCIDDAGAKKKVEWIRLAPNQIVCKFPSNKDKCYFNHGKHPVLLLEWVAFMQEELRAYITPVNDIDIHYDELQCSLTVVCRSDALSFNPPDTNTAAILHRLALFCKKKEKQAELVLKTAPESEENKVNLEKKDAAVKPRPESYPTKLHSNNFNYFTNPAKAWNEETRKKYYAWEEETRKKYYTNALKAYEVARNDLEQLQKKYAAQQQKITFDELELHYLVQKIFVYLNITRVSLRQYDPQSIAFVNFDALFRHSSGLIDIVRGYSKSFSPQNPLLLVENVCQYLSLPEHTSIFSIEKYAPMSNCLPNINDLSRFTPSDSGNVDIIACINTDIELLTRIQSAVALPLDKPHALDENHYLYIQTICNVLHDYHTVLKRNPICCRELKAIQDDFDLAYQEIRNVFFHYNLAGDEDAAQEKRSILITHALEFSANADRYLNTFQRLKTQMQTSREALPSLRNSSTALFVNQNTHQEKNDLTLSGTNQQANGRL